MKQRKGLWFFAILLVAIIIAIFFFRDGRNMDDVEKENLKSAADSAESKLDILNDDFDEVEFDESEIEAATLAYDTIN
ncbi:MAG: hypothetical protein AB8B74_12485 [Crocinitomicaceae bacterium]